MESRGIRDPAGIDLDSAGSVRLVRQELARLNHYDWNDTLPVTDDFVVYAVDLELLDLDQKPDRLPAAGPACLAT